VLKHHFLTSMSVASKLWQMAFSLIVLFAQSASQLRLAPAKQSVNQIRLDPF
jgi:hypothetical protein